MGQRRKDKMKWINGETWESIINRESKWHKWFAWYPVVVSEKTMSDGKTKRVIKAWLCNVQRKGEYFFGYDGVTCNWEYKELNT